MACQNPLWYTCCTSCLYKRTGKHISRLWGRCHQVQLHHRNLLGNLLGNSRMKILMCDCFVVEMCIHSLKGIHRTATKHHHRHHHQHRESSNHHNQKDHRHHSTCVTVAIPKLGFVGLLGSAPWLVRIHFGTLVVRLAFINERENTFHAFGGAATSFCVKYTAKRFCKGKQFHNRVII